MKKIITFLLLLSIIFIIFKTFNGKNEDEKHDYEKFDQMLSALEVSHKESYTPESKIRGGSAVLFGDVDKNRYDILPYEVEHITLENDREVANLDPLQRSEIDADQRLMYAKVAEKTIQVWKDDIRVELEEGDLVVVLYDKNEKAIAYVTKL